MITANESKPKHQIGAMPSEATGRSWVTLVRCRTLLEADLLRSQLEGGGLAVFIPDENLMAAEGWALNTYGYVRVQVKPADYEAARDFLGAPGDAVAE